MHVRNARNARQKQVVEAGYNELDGDTGVPERLPRP